MSKRPQIEVSDVFRKIQPTLVRRQLSPDQYRVFRAIVSCRTAKLGGHLSRCSSCGYTEQSYNSCWNRHCPKCQGGEAFSWTAKRSEELLPIPYFHVVFTLPQEFRSLCFANKKIFYKLLFQASSETLSEVSQNNLKLTPGFFGVLHTWNQELLYHPHIHYAVPGGGIDCQGSWKNFPQLGKFFLPVRILSRVFRGKFIALLKESYRKNRLYLKAQLSHLQSSREFEHLLSRSASDDWVVHAKRPFAGPEIVLKYLANYTHRVGISNYRLRSVDDTTVSFSARHKTRKGKKRLVTLTHESFLQRFMLHVLPKDFRRVRYFGFLASPHKNQYLARIRTELKDAAPPAPSIPHPQTCPVCNSALLRLVTLYNPHRKPKRHWFPPLPAITQPIPLCLSPPFSLH